MWKTILCISIVVLRTTVEILTTIEKRPAGR